MTEWDRVLIERIYYDSKALLAPAPGASDHLMRRQFVMLCREVVRLADADDRSAEFRRAMERAQGPVRRGKDE